MAQTAEGLTAGLEKGCLLTLCGLVVFVYVCFLIYYYYYGTLTRCGVVVEDICYKYETINELQNIWL